MMCPVTPSESLNSQTSLTPLVSAKVLWLQTGFTIHGNTEPNYKPRQNPGFSPQCVKIKFFHRVAHQSACLTSLFPAWDKLLCAGMPSTSLGGERQQCGLQSILALPLWSSSSSPCCYCCTSLHSCATNLSGPLKSSHRKGGRHAKCCNS